jgi:hypothetical protein
MQRNKKLRDSVAGIWKDMNHIEDKEQEKPNKV